MSEEKKSPRSVPEIQQEYQSLCTKVGHFEYQVFALQKEIALAKESLRDLNFEAAAAAQAAKKEEEAKASSEQVKGEQANA